MEENFTPGPWSVELDDGSLNIIAKAGPITVCPGRAHSLGDAHLMAASPDLFEAAEEALKFTAAFSGSNDYADSVSSALRAALAKARGELNA